MENPEIKLVHGTALEVESWMNVNLDKYVWNQITCQTVGERVMFWVYAVRKDYAEQLQRRMQLAMAAGPQPQMRGRH